MPAADYTYVCKLDVLPEGIPRRFETDGLPITLVLSGQELFAIHDVCSLSAVSLSEGEVEDCTIECWLLASRFDLRTGHPLYPPATRPVPAYPVHTEDACVYVLTEPREVG